jgi:hypothetical protein
MAIAHDNEIDANLIEVIMKTSMNAWLLMAVVVGVLLGSQADAAFAAEWLRGDGRSCDEVCRKGGGQALVSGRYKNTPNNYYVCSANQSGEGSRPGYNLKPNWSSVCVVGYGGKEVQARSYSCACE